MVDLLTGVLGAAEGTGEALSSIGGNVSQELAKRLRDEAEAEIAKRVQERSFAHTEKMEQTRTENERNLAQEEFERKKSAGLFDKTAGVGPFEKLVDTKTGKEIARGLETNATTQKKNEYTMSQQIDDLDRKWKQAIEAAKDPAIGYMDQNDRDKINKAYAKDYSLIKQGMIDKATNLDQVLYGNNTESSDILSNAALSPLKSLNEATAKAKEQYSGPLKALSQQFPEAKEGEKKYLGQQGFVFRNGEWQVFTQ
jgi:hypothetical protein